MVVPWDKVSLTFDFKKKLQTENEMEDVIYKMIASLLKWNIRKLSIQKEYPEIDDW